MKKTSAQEHTLKKLFPSCWDTLGLAAPSSMPDKDSFLKALSFLTTQNLTLIHGFSPEEKDTLSYLSAPPALRKAHLNALIRNPEVKAIYCIRGGFGSIQLLEGIDFETLARRKLPVIGYSDITALHMAMLRKKAGIPISGCMALHLEEDCLSPEGGETFSRNFYRAMTLGSKMQCLLESSTLRFPFRPMAQLTALNGNTPSFLQGKLICGNITVMTSLCGTDYFPSFRDKILLLEDIGEPPRRIDACLQQLRLNKVFAWCKAVIFGDFKDCPDRSADLDKMLQRFASALDCPVYKGLHFGHCRRSLSFVQGESVQLRSGLLHCRFPEEK